MASHTLLAARGDGPLLSWEEAKGVGRVPADGRARQVPGRVRRASAAAAATAESTNPLAPAGCCCYSG